MKVELLRNKRNENERLAFASIETKKFGIVRAPLYFSRKEPQPTIVGEAEVMITGVLFPKLAPENYYFDYESAPTCFFIRLVTEEDVKVDFKGFSTIGSMCQTMSDADYFGTKKRLGIITPGRLMQHLYDADFVSGMATEEEQKLVPGVGYVRRHPEKRHWRLEGVDDFKYLNI